MTGAAGLGFGGGGARCGAATQPESVSTPAMPVKKQTAEMFGVNTA